MALIGTQKFAISRWWTGKTIELLKSNRDIFSKARMREVRKELIAGSHVIKSIQGWLQAAQIIKSVKTGEYELTDFGFAIYDNDSKLEKSSSWWAIHLGICFSERSEPYSQFFLGLDSVMKDWKSIKELTDKIYVILKEDVARASIESELEGVRRMFQNDRPLAELGLIETRKNRNEGILIRLGTPKLTDEIIIHALAMMHFYQFKSRSSVDRSSVDFSELLKTGLAHYLCCSPEQLRIHLRRMSQNHRWRNYFGFNEAVNIDSISFGDECDPRKTLLELLQKGEDTWL